MQTPLKKHVYHFYNTFLSYNQQKINKQTNQKTTNNTQTNKNINKQKQ